MKSLFNGDAIIYSDEKISSDIFEKLIPVVKEGAIHIFSLENLEIDCGDKSNKV